MSLRHWVGIAALLSFALFLNLLVWRQEPFSLITLLPLAAAVCLGVVWLLSLLLNASGWTIIEGRVVGMLNAVIASFIFLAICVVIYAFAQTWGRSWDLTQEGRRDLSRQTEQVLQTMTQEVQAYCIFLDIEDRLVRIARDKTLRFLEQCQEHTDLLQVHLMDPQIDMARLEAMNITHVSAEGTVLLRAGNRQRVITLSGGSPRLEEREFTNALINILRRSEPKVAFLTGHNERDILNDDEVQGASIFRILLERESYRPEPYAISLSDAEIPPDVDLLVINNPTGDLHIQEVRAIQEYIERGGRLLIMLEPWTRVTHGLFGREVLRPWLEESFGIVVGHDIAVTDQDENMVLVELSPDNRPFEEVDDGFMMFRGAFSQEHPITRGFDQIMRMQVARTVSAADTVPEGVMVTELLRTKPHFWAEEDIEILAETGQITRDADERTGPLPLAVAATVRAQDDPESGSPRYGRVVVTGDSVFAANAQIGIPGNFNFLMNTIAWLTESEDLIAIRATGIEASPIFVNEAQQRAIIWFSTLFTVQGVALAGIIVFFMRRKFQ